MISFILIFAHILFMSMFQMSGSGGGQDDPLTLTPTGSRNPQDSTRPLGLPLTPHQHLQLSSPDSQYGNAKELDTKANLQQHEHRSPQLLVRCPPSESVGVGTSGWQQRGHLTSFTLPSQLLCLPLDWEIILQWGHLIGTLPSQLLRLPMEWERVLRIKRKTVWSLLQRRGGSLEVQFMMSSMNYKCSTRWRTDRRQCFRGVEVRITGEGRNSRFAKPES